jgi:hypothetical protein
VLLCGSEVYEAIQRYDKAMCVSFSYRMGINEMLKNNQIKLIKVLGNVKIDAGEYLPVLDPDKALLIAKNPSLVNSKPCLLIRRKFSAELSKAIGLDGEAQRMISTIGGVQIINNDKNILGIGIVGYENVGFAVTNYLATCYCNDLII